MAHIFRVFAGALFLLMFLAVFAFSGGSGGGSRSHQGSEVIAYAHDHSNFPPIGVIVIGLVIGAVAFFFLVFMPIRWLFRASKRAPERDGPKAELTLLSESAKSKRSDQASLESGHKSKRVLSLIDEEPPA